MAFVGFLQVAKRGIVRFQCFEHIGVKQAARCSSWLLLVFVVALANTAFWLLLSVVLLVSPNWHMVTQQKPTSRLWMRCCIGVHKALLRLFTKIGDPVVPLLKKDGSGALGADRLCAAPAVVGGYLLQTGAIWRALSQSCVHFSVPILNRLVNLLFCRASPMSNQFT